MKTVALSSKFQIAIPKEIREKLHYQAGDKFMFIAKGDILYLVPVSNLKNLRGIMKGANKSNIRDRRDREL